MALTPTVGTGAIATTTWANEIRDRTIQVFASVAERDAAWVTPPNGATCVTLDTGWRWRRQAGVWRADPARGLASATTDASGNITVTHLSGGTPSSVTASVYGGTGTPTQLQITTITATTFVVRVFNNAGAGVGTTAVQVAWIAWP